MDTSTIANLLIGAGTIAVSAVVALVVGRRRGLDKVEDRADDEVQKTLQAQDRRLALQDREIADLRAEVAQLRAQIATLTTDLHTSDALVRKLTAQAAAQSGDGR